ncbi:hypothetical protein ABEB36_013158 [Hypothenemus hampei]|uniref:Uncharacterized protein n=1 Tax=Hypothenemus hampei TaxID=57062 RepID=A0ABD1E7A6_HYPHA
MSAKYVRVCNEKDTITINAHENSWLSFRAKCWIVSLVLGGSIYCLNFIEMKFLPLAGIIRDIQYPLQVEVNSKGYVINTPGCRIPDMDPFDSTVKEFIFAPPYVNCSNNTTPLFISDSKSIYANLSLIALYNSSGLNCCYQEFLRENPLKDNEPEGRVVYSECHDFVHNINIQKKEFIKINCENNENSTVYQDYFAFVPDKLNMKTNKTERRLNVLILGLDGISRVNLHRQMPKTFDFLTKQLEAIELLGYNKVGDNTFPNLIPVLTGMFENELTETCWPTSSTHFDKCPFVWKNFSERGYVTAYGEDCAWIGLFNYGKSGFKIQPTDYYFTTFNRELENQLGSSRDFNCFQCAGGREIYKTTLDYVAKFSETMQAQEAPYFGFFWSNTLSHDYLNRPSLGDESFFELLSNMHEKGHFNDTALIFISDHGIRWGNIRNTYQGLLEERLPFVFLSLPAWFKSQYSQAMRNLKKNARRLTTPFDLHETLKNFLDLDRTFSNKPKNISRSYSLLTEIPKNRTCQEAQIESHWCACQESIEISVNDSSVTEAANFAVQFINTQLQGYAQCASLALDDVLSARLLTYSKKLATGKSAKDYMTTLKTIPSGGIFEV